MTIERKVGMGIAGQPSGGATDVAEVFSTYLYTGNAGVNAINNGNSNCDNSNRNGAGIGIARAMAIINRNIINNG